MRMSRGGVSAGDAIHLAKVPNRAVIISALGVTQIFAWGTSYYLPAVLAAPIVADTGWSLAWVVGGLSLGLLTAGVISPSVVRAWMCTMLAPARAAPTASRTTSSRVAG